MSRLEMDRPRSNIGPAPVHFAACAIDFAVLRRRLGPGYLKRVSLDLDVPVGTAKKWFLGQTRPGFERRLALAAAYGPLLAPVGHLSTSEAA